jgi:hypothetical protein
MSSITKDNKIIAMEVAKAFGGKPNVQRFWDERDTNYVDILKCVDRPQNNVTSYATIGLSDAPLYKDGSEYPARLELVGACGSRFEGLDNALATAAFCIINSKWFCYPGAVFSDILSMYTMSSSMHHFFFTPPFLWEETLKTMTIGDKSVAWLLAVPISNEERAFAEDQGSDALETLFEEKQIDIFDLERQSVV